MEQDDIRRIRKWLWFAYAMLAFMALLSSLGGFFVRIFLIGALFAGWQILSILFRTIWQKARAGTRQSFRPRAKHTTSRPGSEGYEQPKADRPPVTPTPGPAVNPLGNWFRRIPIAVKIAAVIWVLVGSFIIFVFVIIFSSDEEVADAEYYRQVAESYYNQEKYDTAYLYYRQAMDIDPESPKIMFGYANVLYTRNFPDSTLYYYDRILEIDPNNYDARYNKAWVYRERKEYSRSNDIMSELLSIYPDAWGVKEFMGDNYYDLGNRNEAKRLYLEAWPFDQENLALNERLGELMPGADGQVYRDKVAATQ